MSADIMMLIAGNWKMNGVNASLSELKTIAKSLDKEKGQKNLEALICLPSTLLARGADVVKGSALAVGGEDCHFADSGAHTGDISALMLKDAGASYVIIGHSERRADHHESDALVRKKVEAAWRAGLTAILCVGETLDQRERGAALDIVGRQCDDSVPDGAVAERLVIAYEPVWAIGTGKVPTVGNITEVHNFIREKMQKRFGEQGDRFRLIYGGSVKSSNAAEILSILHVNGALIGGASLKASDFLDIIRAAAAL